MHVEGVRVMGGTYIVCDLDGTPLRVPVAAFRVVPYFTRREINPPDLDLFIDISTKRMCKLKHSTAADPDDPEVAAVIAEDQAEDDDTDSDKEEEI